MIDPSMEIGYKLVISRFKESRRERLEKGKLKNFKSIFLYKINNPLLNIILTMGYSDAPRVGHLTNHSKLSYFLKTQYYISLDKKEQIINEVI